MKDGGSAFPRTGHYHDDADTAFDSTSLDGMTLRDWFATHADEQDISNNRKMDSQGQWTTSREQAKFLYADAMIAERDKK